MPGGGDPGFSREEHAFELTFVVARRIFTIRPAGVPVRVERFGRIAGFRAIGIAINVVVPSGARWIWSKSGMSWQLTSGGTFTDLVSSGAP